MSKQDNYQDLYRKAVLTLSDFSEEQLKEVIDTKGFYSVDNSSDRVKALAWWNSLKNWEKVIFTDNYNSCFKRHHNSLTGREIESIFNYYVKS